MKDELIAIYNLLGDTEIKGAKNIFNMYRVFAVLEKIIKELDEKDSSSPYKQENKRAEE